MTGLLRRASRRSFDEVHAARGGERGVSATRADRAPRAAGTEGPIKPSEQSSSGWGRKLLAGVGIALTLTGSLIDLLPFFTRTSGFVAAPGTIILAAGVLLVVMSAFFDSTGGVGGLPGWRVWFGRVEEPDGRADSDADGNDQPPDDVEPNA